MRLPGGRALLCPSVLRQLYGGRFRIACVALHWHLRAFVLLLTHAEFVTYHLIKGDLAVNLVCEFFSIVQFHEVVVAHLISRISKDLLHPTSFRLTTFHSYSLESPFKSRFSYE